MQINVQRDVGNLSELYWLNQNYKLNFRLKLMATLARHLNFLVPSQVRSLLDLSFSPYYPEKVQTACSGATAAPGAGTNYQQCTPT